MLLQSIHDKVTGWVAGIVIGAICLTFIFWGVDVGFGTVGYAAKVEGHEWPLWKPGKKITLQEVNRLYQNQLTQYQQMMRGDVPPELRTEIQNNLMDAVVRRELIEQHATHLGYRVREEDINRSIEQEPAFQIDGKFSEEVATRMLDQQGISRRAFRDDQRRQLQIAQLQAAIAASSFVTPAELARARALQDQEREVSWAVIDPSALVGTIQPDDASIADYYAKNKKSFMTPESVTLKYVALKLGDIAPTIQVSDDVLRAEYEQVKERFVSAERRRGRHILVNAPQGGDESAARKKADEVLAKAKAPGADFSKLAKELSDDAGSAQQGGDLGWAERSFFVGPFSDALFSMQPNEIRGPVRSEFGYHIIRLDGIEPGHQKNFEEVRAELENEYRTQQAERIFGERQETLAEKAFENIDTLDGVAKDLGVAVQTVTDFHRAGGGGPFANDEKVIEAAFNDNVLNGQNSEPVEIEPGYVVVLRAADRKMPQERSLDSVRAQIEQAVKKQRAAELARSRAEEALKKLQAGAAWPTVVADLEVPAAGPKFVTRTDAEVPTGLRQAIFLAPKPAAGKPAYEAVPLPDGQYGLIALTNVRAGTVAEAPEQRGQRLRQLAGRMAQTEVTSYIEELRRKADVDTNPNAFE